jgi:hypothetical protein
MLEVEAVVSQADVGDSSGDVISLVKVEVVEASSSRRTEDSQKD